MNKINKSLVYCVVFIASLHANEKLLTINALNYNASAYAGNMHPVNGLTQLKLLKQEGMLPDHSLLEIGCGALMAAIPIMNYLNAEHYVAIEPNEWLIKASLAVSENKEIADNKKPKFFHNVNFEVNDANLVFDYIIAHSIISHAPLWQLRLFLKKCSEVLHEGGKVVFSVRLTKPNAFSDLSEQPESTTNEWQYPGNTFFHQKTIEQEALKYFSKVEYKPDYTAIIVSTDRSAFHDWFVLTK